MTSWIALPVTIGFAAAGMLLVLNNLLSEMGRPLWQRIAIWVAMACTTILTVAELETGCLSGIEQQDVAFMITAKTVWRAWVLAFAFIAWHKLRRERRPIPMCRPQLMARAR